MPGRSPWGSTFVGPEPVTMAAEDDNRIQMLVTPGPRIDPHGRMAPPSLEWGGCDTVDVDVYTRILDATRFEDDGTRARFTCAAEGEGNECRCSY